MIIIQSSSVAISNIGWSRNKIWYKIQGNTTASNSYFCLLEVSILGTSQVFSQRQSPDSAGIFFFEIDGILESILKDMFFQQDNVLPTFNQATPSITQTPVTFLIKFTEYSSPNIISSIERTIKCISAGFDYDDFTHQNQREWLFTKHKFFTSTSDPKPAMPDVEDYAYFYNTYNYQVVDIWVELQYKDNSVSSYIAYANFDSAKKTIIIPTGYKELQIDANRDITKPLYGWRVWVTKHNNSNLRASEPLNYVLDEQSTLEKRKFLFGNSLGGYETFFCKANLQDMISSKKTINKRLYGQDYRLRDGENFVGNQDGKRSFTVATGWLSTAFADALQDAAIAKEVWEITPKGFIPIIVESITAIYYEKNNELIGYVFQASYAYDVDLYTKDIQRKANGLPIFEPEPTYTVSIPVHYRGIAPAAFKPVIELNEKIDSWTIQDTFSLVSNMQYKCSDAVAPNWDSLPLLTYSQALLFIAQGAGNTKIQLNPTIIAGYTEATFRFEYDKFGIAPPNNWGYNFANSNSIDTVIGFKRKAIIISLTGYSLNSMYYKVRTSPDTPWEQPLAINIAALNALIALLADGTSYEVQLVNIANDNINISYNY